MSTPFSLRIFVADGDPDGLRLVERSNWVGKAVMFPRASYTTARKRSEFQQTGVYLLLGPGTNGDGEVLYVGEGDPVGPRLESHYASKEFWTRAVFFVAGMGQLNKAHVQYLESRLVAQAIAAKRVKLDNGNRPAEPSLSEADKADMDVFLANILGMLPALAIQAFEQATMAPVANDNEVLFCRYRGSDARGLDAPQGFVVLKGSKVARDVQPSFATTWASYNQQREELIQNGVVAFEGSDLVFTQDYTFNSPSMASAVVHASSPSGRTDWVNSEGKTLRDIQQAATAVVDACAPK